MKKNLSLLLLFFIPLVSVFGQFGQNRVQYKEYDWRYIETRHFDIYFSPEGKEIAEFTASAAEDAVRQIQEMLDYRLGKRISLIVYNSHNDFQETNTTDSYISQGVGGFTEPFKNRVVFPFEGSYQKFRHVIHHELVHAVMRDMLYGGTVQNIISRGITLQLPIWFHEGMSEYISSGWETNSDMFIRDAIINEYLPDINQLGGYFAYRGGQCLFYYIAEQYGKEKVGEILHKTKGLGSVEEGFKSSIGIGLEELNERWKKAVKREYWPEIADRKDPEEIAKRLTDNQETGGFYNTSPALSPQGDKVAFISDRDIFLDVYIMNTVDGKVIKKVIEGGRTNVFEELNVLFPSITWAPDNKRIALAKKSAGYDRIYVMNVETEEGETLPFKLDGVESVSWSPDGTRLAFIGANAEQSDVYIYNVETKELSNLTDDIFSEYDPSWSPDNNEIFFSSDRGDYLTEEMLPEDFDMYRHDYHTLDLYRYNIEKSSIERITDWELSTEKSVVFNPDGNEILFVSDFNGIDNIYKKRITITESDTVNSVLELKAVPVTNSLNGINQLSISKDGGKLVFTSLYDAGYNIYLLNKPFSMQPVAEKLQPTSYMAELIRAQDDTTVGIGAEKMVRVFADDTTFFAGKNQSMKVDSVIIDPEGTEEETADNDTTVIFTGSYVAEDDTVKQDSSNYSNYVFGNVRNPEKTLTEAERDSIFTSSLDENGNYLVNEYKISFSPDLIYANAGYSTFYGLLGTTVLSFSDVLGNHRLIGVTSLQVDLKNSDYGLAYYYLAKRINYGFEGFHTARFVYLSDGPYSSNLYRFRNYGGVVSASYPLSRFYRVESSLSLLNVSADNLDNLNAPNEKSTFVVPSVSFVHDNTLFGYTAPIEGSRYKLSLFGNPGIGSPDQQFFSATWDYRKYYRFWYDNNFTFRLSGGVSGGPNPQRFFLGGTESWINRSFAQGEIPIQDPADFAFLSPAMPLRGYDYAESIGSKYSLVNMELRMPIIRAILTGPLPILLRNIMGVVFIDAGAAWDNTDKLKLFTKNETGHTVTDDLLMGVGYGFRLNFIMLWKFDMAYKFNGNSFDGPRFYLSLGLDF